MRRFVHVESHRHLQAVHGFNCLQRSVRKKPLVTNLPVFEVLPPPCCIYLNHMYIPSIIPKTKRKVCQKTLYNLFPMHAIHLPSNFKPPLVSTQITEVVEDFNSTELSIPFPLAT
jgi:hypothetical protein